MTLAVGDRVRHVHHSEYGHGTVLEVVVGRAFRYSDTVVPPSVLVDWDRPSRLTRHGPRLLRKLTVFDKLALLAEEPR